MDIERFAGFALRTAFLHLTDLFIALISVAFADLNGLFQVNPGKEHQEASERVPALPGLFCCECRPA